MSHSIHINKRDNKYTNIRYPRYSPICIIYCDHSSKKKNQVKKNTQTKTVKELRIVVVSKPELMMLFPSSLFVEDSKYRKGTLVYIYIGIEAEGIRNLVNGFAAFYNATVGLCR